jgi:hypothetical protein
MMEEVEKQRANEACPAGLNRDAFAAAWQAFQGCPIDLVADSDDETCRCLGAAIVEYMSNAFLVARR